MGVKDFFKIRLPDGRTIADLGRETTLAAFSGQRLAVDALGVLYPYMKMLMAVRGAGFTDAEGKCTVHLMAAATRALEYRKAGIETVWVFDNAAGNSRKAATNAARAAGRAAAESAAGQFGITGEMVRDVIALFDVMGVTYIIVPPDVEAEEYGAKMTYGSPAARLCAAMISGDTDVLMFGGSLLYYSTVSKVYSLFEQDDVVAAVGSREALVTAGVLLGTDFNAKTAGVGPAAVLKRAASIELAADQVAARAYFLNREIGTVVPLVTHDMDAGGTLEMLVARGFSREMWSKKLTPATAAAPGRRRTAAAAAAPRQ